MRSNDVGGQSWRKIAKRVRVPLGLLFTAAFLTLARPTWTSLLVSVPFVVLGLLIRAYAAGYLKKRSELATTGPYAYTRNPLYLGSAFLAVGCGIGGANPFLAVGLAALFVAIYVPTILNEEAFLRERFPEFDAYTSTVPRLFPRLAPARRSDASDGGFSWAQYLKNREYQALIGGLAQYAVLIARILWTRGH